MFKRLGTFFLDIFEVIVFAVGIFFFIYLLIMRPHKISGQSMMPNFPDSEYLLTEKVTYYLRNPERGDVVVFTPPISNTDEFIKRVIGLPGENVMVQNDHVYINDKLLQEPYLKDTVVTTGGTFLTDGQEFTVPQGEYFVMGDNRPNSSDSRYWGPITKSAISGRAWIIYWPISNAGVVQKPVYNF
jgi:signal peptidase I